MDNNIKLITALLSSCEDWNTFEHAMDERTREGAPECDVWEEAWDDFTGWVSDGALTAQVESRLDEMVSDVLSQQVELDSLGRFNHFDWYEGWALDRDENGNFEGPAIIASDWNARSEWDEEQKRHVSVGPKSLFSDLLEALGYALEWSDTVARCDCCSGAIQTEPDHYGWTPSYAVMGSEHTCERCIEEDEDIQEAVLEHYRGAPHLAVTFDFDFEQHGYVKLPVEFQHGLYGGQRGNPAAIAEYLETLGIFDYIFEVGSVGQFDCRFHVWAKTDEIPLWAIEYEVGGTMFRHSRYADFVRDPETEEPFVFKSPDVRIESFRRYMPSDYSFSHVVPYLPALEQKGNAGEDPAEVMRKALASIPVTTGKPGHVTVHSIGADGTVATRHVSHRDFVEKGIND